MIWRFPTAIIAIRFPRALGATEAVHGAVTQLQQPLQTLQAQAALQARVVLQDPAVHQDRVHPQEAALAEIPAAEDGK